MVWDNDGLSGLVASTASGGDAIPPHSGYIAVYGFAIADSRQVIIVAFIKMKDSSRFYIP